MKRCPQCHFIYPDEDEICDFDQAPLVDTAESEIAAITNTPERPGLADLAATHSRKSEGGRTVALANRSGTRASARSRSLWSLLCSASANDSSTSCRTSKHQLHSTCRSTAFVPPSHQLKLSRRNLPSETNTKVSNANAKRPRPTAKASDQFLQAHGDNQQDRSKQVILLTTGGRL